MVNNIVLLCVLKLWSLYKYFRVLEKQFSGVSVFSYTPLSVWKSIISFFHLYWFYEWVDDKCIVYGECCGATVSQEGYVNPTYNFKVFSNFEIYLPGVVTYTFNPKPRRQREADFCDFQASLVYLASSRPAGLHSETV